VANRITILVAALISVIGFSAGVVLMNTSSESLACTADARLDAPDGWVWQRDGSNDCAWTLYDADGDAAPDHVYDEAGEEPPPASSDVPAWIAYAVGVGGLAVIAITAVRSKRDSDSGSAVD
jgi:hypothetical protein